MIVTDAKTGAVFKENGQPYQVVKYEFIKVSRGSAGVKLRVKNLLTGAVVEKGYVSTAKIEPADITHKNAQYLYKEGNGYVFMDPDTYEQVTVGEDILGDSTKYLLEGCKVQVMYYEGTPVTIDLPINMEYEVTYTEPGYKGNTVNNNYKAATISTGAQVRVPLFIKIGDHIRVDTRTGEYSSKA